MNLFSWNCRGLGLSRTVQELIALVGAKSPRLVFLSETRTSGARAANLRWRLGLKNCIAVDCSSTGGGGLALFWHEAVDVTLIEKHKRFIDVHVSEPGLSSRFRITFVYGEPRTEDRHLMWELMRRLHGALVWCLAGTVASHWRFQRGHVGL